MTTTHIMIDLETVSKTNTAAILSIGAVAFDPNEPNIGAEQSAQKFHVRCDLKHQEKFLTIDGDTVEWWLDPEREEARQQLASMPKIDIVSALAGLVEWMDSQPGDTLVIYGNGSMFDNAILLNAFEKVGVEPPQKWTYKADSCYRTFKRIVGVPAPVAYGVAHGALDDAIAQANHLKAIVAHLGITL